MTCWFKIARASALVVLLGCGSAAPSSGDSGKGGSTSGAGSGGATGSSGKASSGSAGTGASSGSAEAGSAGTSSAGSTGTTGTSGSSGATGTGASGSGGATGTGSSGSTVARDAGTGTTRTDGGSGAAGADGGAGTTGDGGTIACTITSQAVQSTAIPTVFTVTWSTNLSNLTSAEIDFGPSSSGPTMVAPVDLTQPSYKTILIGMKPSSSYVYRILAKTSTGSCTGEDAPIMTGALTNAPKPTVTISSASSHDKGFIVTSSGLTGSSAYIMDPDGTVVWAAPMGVPSEPSRVHLSWDATKMYEMSLNVMNTGSGKIVLQPLDGSAATTLAGVAASHHDLAAIPGGLTTPMWNTSGIDAPCSVVEFTEAGVMTTVVADVGTLYNSSTFHTNSIHYYARDNDYTIGDRNPNLYVKISRTGDLIWQFGGTNPKDPTKFFSGVTTWQVNHGHDLSADGTFVFFNNDANEMWNYKLDESTMTASQVMHYTASGATSDVLGDAQVLPNGNILVTFSTGGQMHEITPSGTLVMKIAAPTPGQNFGYAEFRESLYGPPPY
jgi:hypothetical protein